MRKLTYLVAGALIATACSGSPTALQLEGLFEVASVNGERLPAHRIEIISNEAGTCEIDITGGHLSFGPTGNYNMSIQYSRACSGVPNAVRSDTQFSGTYTRSASELTFMTRVYNGDTIERAIVQGNAVIVDVRRTSGTRFQLRYEAVHQG